jgi:hypothetical protein
MGYTEFSGGSVYATEEEERKDIERYRNRTYI